MVFRGIPSKACERCRARRLKCDLHIGTCGQCVRTSLPCSGYRDTQLLRILDESLSVARKVWKDTPSFEPRFLPLSIDLQARDAFFSYYVTAKCWNFLKPYYHPTDCPDHLTLAIEAVSLAYHWHQLYSDAALSIARERYVLALRMINRTLKSSKEAIKDTTLLASLLLDLFEKITNSEPRNNKSWNSHVNGALTLVRLRGVEKFQAPSELGILARLTGNYITSCLASGSPVSVELNAIRAYIGKRSNPQDPKLRLSGLMIQYANLRSDIRRGIISNDEHIEASLELDLNLQALVRELPTAWQYSTKVLYHQPDRIFDLRFDSYPDSRVCQVWNILRVIRILVNESMIEIISESKTGHQSLAMLAAAHGNIDTLASEICSSVPQYVDCDIATPRSLPTSETLKLSDPFPNHGSGRPGHYHSHDHQLDCYTIIFPLYVAGRSKGSPEIRKWVTQQLHYIGSHFYIRNAEAVAQILEGETDASLWEVHSILGSYALAA